MSLVQAVLRMRSDYGITRVGSITRLDRIGIPVVQVARPLALSNAVSQGKGLTVLEAAASALMESLETWSAERIPQARTRMSTAADLGTTVQGLYCGSVARDAPLDWPDRPMAWTDGWDLLAEASLPVPLALVDTRYVLPSPHPRVFPRTTTGLAGAATLEEALVHAGLEILERDAVAQAHRRPHFFDRCRVDAGSIEVGPASEILRRIVRAGLTIGLWRVPAAHALPIYWCHVMEGEGGPELAPLPGEGFGCDLTHERALAKALLEAVQARLGAISGAREDITRRSYPSNYDREHLADWRRELGKPGRLSFEGTHERKTEMESRLKPVLGALATAGARAVMVVPLFTAPEIMHVVRVVAPPLAPASHL